MTRRKIIAGSRLMRRRSSISTAPPASCSTMSDLIRVVDLEVWANLGVPEEERSQAQRLLISLEMRVESFAHAAATDSLSRTVDYFGVAERVKHFVSEHSRRLLETLAE